MKIIALASCLSSQRGGLERSLLDVCRSLAVRGNSMSVIYTESGDQLEAYQTFCDRLLLVSSYRLSKQQLLTSGWQMVADLLAGKKLEADVVYSNQYENFFFGACLARLMRIPFVCHVRLPAPSQESLLKRPKQAFTLNSISHYIAISQGLQQEWCRTLNLPLEKVSIVYNGIASDRFSPAPDLAEARQPWSIAADEQVISYVGRLDPPKGVDILLQAFKQLREQGTQAKLLIAGKSLIAGAEYEAHLKQLASDLDLAEDVQFLGHISDTAEIYKISNISVLPCIWAEPFGRVVIEAMACGTPVVASRSGGIPEILTGEFQQGLCQPGNIEQLSHTLQAMLNRHRENPDLGRRCQQHVLENFSLEQTIKRTEDVLAQVVGSR